MMVFRRRSGSQLRPINRIKHVVDSQQGITLNVAVNVELIKAVDAPVLANTNEVVTGSRVNGIYLNVEAYATTAGALANIYIMMFKNPSGVLSRIPNPNVVGASDLKKFVFHQEMRMLEQSVNGNPRSIFNGVIAIPKHMRRMGPDDRVTLKIFAPGVDTFVCLQCHYKEFR